MKEEMVAKWYNADNNSLKPMKDATEDEITKHRDWLWENLSDSNKEYCLKKAKEILGLVTPLIEQEVREEIWGEVNNLLRISMNEMGFVEISNHIDFGDWQSLKGGQHE